ncbi:hypothetical protein PRZ48_003608 [Zasmidium cellare]|uniref:GDP/GTP exchange factor Sec2 N-terminal domain-containing protein n=1 Tax=Zasmidium cellare TaxID=395010 RepID=A0ABR0EXR4_ZASCE|nr:hypothetical protein PRZ48_003608 [Zasmidium cellare]
MAFNALPNGIQATHRHNDSALYVGNGKDEAARLRIKELEEENHILAQRATDASQHYANYENQIRVLQTQLQQQRHEANNARLAAEQEQPAPQPDRMGLSRLGSFMRKPSLAPTPTPSHDSSAREQELEAKLFKEQNARIEAEKKVKVVNAEIEELSATLFQQANDMVAAERKDNAALKDKIKELEKTGGSVSEVMRKENERLKQKLQTLEQREVERKRRLDRLEAAQKRIDRVRTMLRPP